MKETPHSESEKEEALHFELDGADGKHVNRDLDI